MNYSLNEVKLLELHVFAACFLAAWLTGHYCSLLVAPDSSDSFIVDQPLSTGAGVRATLQREGY